MVFATLSFLKFKVEHALAPSANIPGDSVETEHNMKNTDTSEPTPFPALNPVLSRIPSSQTTHQPPTSARPIRTYTQSSAASSTTSSSSSFFSRGIASGVTSATSLPLSSTSSRSTGSCNPHAVHLLPPLAPSPDYPLNPDDAKAVLSMDGGGVRGIFTPLFLIELQKHLPPDVDFRTLLDLVGGTSTGGVAALMLARLALPLDKILATYTEMPKLMFGRRRFKGIWWLFTNSQHSTERQKKLYGLSVREALGDEKALLKSDEESDGKPQCPCFVVTLETGDLFKPIVLSSYTPLYEEQKSDSNVPHNRNDDISIVTAALATSAAPTFFHPTVYNGHSYIDGGVGFNNPSEVALKQVRKLYGPNAYVHTFISLGTGHRVKNPYCSPHKKRPLFGFWLGVKGALGVFRAFTHISTDSHMVNERMSERFEQTGAYYRFNPPGLEDVALDDWSAVDTAVEKCKAYLALPETQAMIAEVAARLLMARGMSSKQ